MKNKYMIMGRKGGRGKEGKEEEKKREKKIRWEDESREGEEEKI